MNNIKKRYLIAIITVVILIVSFSIGYYIGNTISVKHESIQGEPTAYELLERLNKDDGKEEN